MNPFKSDSVPYVATLLISVLGWMLTTLHSEIRSSTLLSYETRAKNDVMTLQIRNVSSKAVIENAYVALVCPDHAECLLPVNPKGPPRYGSVVVMRPTGDRPTILYTDQTYVSARVSLPPNGVAGLSTRYRGSPPEFYYYYDGPNGLGLDPDSGSSALKSTALEVVEARSAKGLFLAHYPHLLGLIFIATVLTLAAWLIGSLFPRARKDEKDETPPLNVVLRLADDNPG